MTINSNLDINQVKPHLNSSFGVCYANEEKEDMDLRESKGGKRREESCNYIIILKILWKRGHRGNTIWTVPVVWESAETIGDGTHLESCYLEGALSNGAYYDQLSFSVFASWSLSVEPLCSPHASNRGIQPCYGPGTMGLNEHGWTLQKLWVKRNIYLF